MRRIVVFNRITADGYFASASGGLDWVVPEAAIDAEAVTHMPDTDTMLFGRRTYELFESFWPGALANAGTTAADPHSDRHTEAIRAMAVWIDRTPKVVFSRSRTSVTWNHSHLVHELDPSAVEAMKRAPGKDMIVFGSGSLVSQLTEHGLVDEYELVVSPVFLGSGRPLLTGLSKTVRLTLAEAKSYPSGNVKLRYVPAR